MNVGDIRAASDTTRVGGAVDDVRIRERRRRLARQNLSAFAVELHPGDLRAAWAWRDELADMLGLDPPVDEPAGYCRCCGKELALANTSTAGRHGIRRGYCGQACSREAAR